MADNARQLLVKVVVDTDKAEKGLKKVSDSTDKFKKSADKASDEVKDLGKNTKTAGENAEKTAKQTDKLSDSTEDATKKFGGLKDSVDNLTEPFKKVHSSLDGVNKLLGVAGITVGLGTVATLMKNAAESAHQMRTELENSTTTLSNLTGRTDTANLQAIRDRITASDLGISSTDAANVVGLVAKYFGGSDTDIQNISQKILTLQKMGADVDVKSLSDNMEAAGINTSNVADSIDKVYFAAADTKLTFSEFTDEVERLVNLTTPDNLMAIEDFYRATRGQGQTATDYAQARSNIDAAISAKDVRMYGMGSGASVGRVLSQYGEDWQQYSNQLYAQTQNSALSDIGAAVVVGVAEPLDKLSGVFSTVKTSFSNLFDMFGDQTDTVYEFNEDSLVPLNESLDFANTTIDGINTGNETYVQMSETVLIPAIQGEATNANNLAKQWESAYYWKKAYQELG